MLGREDDVIKPPESNTLVVRLLGRHRRSMTRGQALQICFDRRSQKIWTALL